MKLFVQTTLNDWLKSDSFGFLIGSCSGSGPVEISIFSCVSHPDPKLNLSSLSQENACKIVPILASMLPKGLVICGIYVESEKTLSPSQERLLEGILGNCCQDQPAGVILIKYGQASSSWIGFLSSGKREPIIFQALSVRLLIFKTKLTPFLPRSKISPIFTVNDCILSNDSLESLPEENTVQFFSQSFNVQQNTSKLLCVAQVPSNLSPSKIVDYLIDDYLTRPHSPRRLTLYRGILFSVFDLASNSFPFAKDAILKESSPPLSFFSAHQTLFISFFLFLFFLIFVFYYLQ